MTQKIYFVGFPFILAENEIILCQAKSAFKPHVLVKVIE